MKSPPAVAMLAILLTSAVGAWVSCEEYYLLMPEETLRHGNARYAPQWTPDGSQIVFTGEDELFGQTYVVGSDGSDLRRISDNQKFEVDYSPDVSPDVFRIVYATTRYETPRSSRDFELESSGLDGSDRRRLTETNAHDTSPSWSPDGSRIAFLRDGTFVSTTRRGGDRGIYTVASDGSDERLVIPFRSSSRELTEGGDFFSDTSRHSPTWSPKGQSLAFVMKEIRDVRDEEGQNLAYVNTDSLYTIGVDGSGLKELFSAPGNTGFFENSIFGQPAWSPDGRRIAFLSVPDQGSTTVLYTVGPDGSGLSEVARAGRPHLLDPSVAWSPDGNKILFSLPGIFTSAPTPTPAPTEVANYVPPEQRKFLGEVYVVHADGSGLRAVGQGAHASWSPDGTRIAIIVGYGEHAHTFLYTVAAAGSDPQVLARVDAQGSLVATVQGESSGRTLPSDLIVGVAIVAALVAIVALYRIIVRRRRPLGYPPA